MAWPFSDVAAPNLEFGPDLDVPTSLDPLDTAQLWLTGAHFINDNAASRTVTVRNTAGKRLWSRLIPGGGEMPYEWPFRPSLGLKWVASGAGVTGHIWGYK